MTAECGRLAVRELAPGWRESAKESCPDGAPRQGLLQKVVTPTLASLEWEFGVYRFPVPLEAIDLPDDPPTWLSAVTGVVTRRLRTASGAVEGTWTYSQTLPFGSESEESITSVRSPLQDRTDHFFNVGKDQNRIYGLSYTPLETHPTRTDLFQSSRAYDCDAGGGSCVAKRSTYLEYQTDALFPGDTPEVNPRIAATLVRYHDDSDRWAAVDSSSFDGLGHYRTETTSGNYPGVNVRTTTTHFNPGAGTYPGSFVLPAANAPWVLGTFDRIDDFHPR